MTLSSRAARWFWRSIYASCALALLLAFVEWKWSVLRPWGNYDIRTIQGSIITVVRGMLSIVSIITGLVWLVARWAERSVHV